jgi:hypothetical protein
MFKENWQKSIRELIEVSNDRKQLNEKRIGPLVASAITWVITTIFTNMVNSYQAGYPITQVSKQVAKFREDMM